jgi:hypothetical protein
MIGHLHHVSNYSLPSLHFLTHLHLPHVFRVSIPSRLANISFAFLISLTQGTLLLAEKSALTPRREVDLSGIEVCFRSYVSVNDNCLMKFRECGNEDF